MTTKLTNITKGSADVVIDGHYVGTVTREGVVRRAEIDEDVSPAMQTGTGLMGSQTVEFVTEVQAWVAHRWSGTVRTEFGSATTRAEAIRILEDLR